MNPLTQHDPAARMADRTGRAYQRRWLTRRRGPSRAAGAGILGLAAVAAVLFGSALPASATLPPGSPRGADSTPAGAVAGNRLKATFTATPVSVTPNLGMVELILSGNGTVQGFGAATEVVGLVQDHTVTPCGAGSYSDTASRRIVMHGGALILHEAGMTCMTTSGLQATATYQVDGRASTGIFASARGTGDVTVDVATHQETLSGKLILAPPAA